jgi:carboxymethylenebutenolidase
MDRKQASDYPQELLDIFHEFQHGEIDRRSFLDRISKFAVGGLTAIGIMESLTPNYAWAQQVKKEDARIAVSTETVPSPQGNGSIRGHFAKPARAAGKIPAVLVIHENRGLNPYIEDVARRFATENFIAYAPDGLTSVGGYTGDEQTSAAAFRNVDSMKMYEDFVASFNWLKSRPDCSGKVGIVGFCFGGGIVNQFSWRVPDLAAGSAFYGSRVSDENVPKISAPVQQHLGSLDTRITGAWPAFEAALKANNKVYAGYVYEGANHGFHNDTTPRYDEAAAKLAWTRTLEWFNKYLR